MKEYIRMKLWGVSFWKPLFREELIKILETSEPTDYFDLLVYCYSKYSDMHPEILEEVFTKYKKYVKAPVTLKN